MSNVLVVLDQEFRRRLFDLCSSSAELRQPIDGIGGEVKAIEIVQHGHVERRRDRAFLFVPAHVQIPMVGAPIGQSMNQPWIAVVRENDRFVPCEQAIEVVVAQAVRVFARRLKLHQIDDVHEADLQRRQLLPEKCDGGQRFERRHIAGRGHDEIGFGASVRARPVPDANPRRAVADRIVHAEPLRRRVLAGDDDVHVVPAAEAVIDHTEQAIRVGWKIHADDFGFLVERQSMNPGSWCVKPL